MHKLKISDLSVGDWVMVEGEDWKVSAINSDSVGLRVGNDYAMAEISECDGIFITPEILEKNGFEICEGDWIGHDYRCIVQQHGGYWDVLSSKRGYYRTIRIDGLECVHQLQHAIRLAGTEKEIEL